MGRYVNRPDFGRQVISRTQVIERIIEKPSEKTTEKQPEIDVQAIANAVALALASKISQMSQTSSNNVTIKQDSFDNSKTLENLAKSMLVQRGDSESNFDGLGNIKETKKNVDEINRTIDLLSDLE